MSGMTDFGDDTEPIETGHMGYLDADNLRP
jgi:hypothetical protein